MSYEDTIYVFTADEAAEAARKYFDARGWEGVRAQPQDRAAILSEAASWPLLGVLDADEFADFEIRAQDGAELDAAALATDAASPAPSYYYVEEEFGTRQTGFLRCFPEDLLARRRYTLSHSA